jgi:hypothetical protein
MAMQNNLLLATEICIRNYSLQIETSDFYNLIMPVWKWRLAEKVKHRLKFLQNN